MDKSLATHPTSDTDGAPKILQSAADDKRYASPLTDDLAQRSHTSAPNYPGSVIVSTSSASLLGSSWRRYVTKGILNEAKLVQELSCVSGP